MSVPPTGEQIEDRIVAVIGPIGVGKSTFIEAAIRQGRQTINHGLTPGAKELRAYRVTHPVCDQPVVFMDTPGFDDDVFMSGMDILAMITDWLVKNYNGKVHNIDTLLYLHRISDNRMARSSLKNLQMVSKAMPNVIITTTMWGDVEEEIGMRREQELRELFCKDMLQAGCRTERFLNTHDSAWRIIGSVGDRAGLQVRLPNEILDNRPGIKETKASSAASRALSREDGIVLVIGPTGAGKSTFIERATGQNNHAVGRGWKSCTAEIQTIRTTHPINGYPVVFVDTPGLDHTDKSDMEILAMIAEWSVKANTKVAAILYFHRITDNRMSGAAMKNLRLFSSLCGQKVMPHVVVVTTMWGKVNREEAVKWEDVLKQEVWQDKLGKGYSVSRFEDTYASAWDIIGSLTQKNSGMTLLIQEEMTLGKPLDQTRAGIDVNTATEIVPKSLLRKIRSGFWRLFGWNR